MTIEAKNIDRNDLVPIYDKLKSQCNDVLWIEKYLNNAWVDFLRNKFSYDGATFVKEYNDEFWEVSAFVHDWMNGIGHVGKEVDLLFIKMMLELNYGENIIFERCKWMQWTFLNVIRHKLKRTFKSNRVPNNQTI